jgi:hypothetical protein
VFETVYRHMELELPDLGKTCEKLDKIPINRVVIVNTEICILERWKLPYLHIVIIICNKS